jgi:hypothetical protein
VVTIDQNRWSRSVKFTGHDLLEWVVTVDQNTHLTNGRCKNHGGMSTGPKTPEGRQAISQATRKRMASGARIQVLEGFYRWLEGGGGEMLSRLAKAREGRKRWRRLMLQ